MECNGNGCGCGCRWLAGASGGAALHQRNLVRDLFIIHCQTVVCPAGKEETGSGMVGAEQGQIRIEQLPQMQANLSAL